MGMRRNKETLTTYSYESMYLHSYVYIYRLIGIYTYIERTICQNKSLFQILIDNPRSYGCSSYELAATGVVVVGPCGYGGGSRGDFQACYLQIFKSIAPPPPAPPRPLAFVIPIG